MQVTGGRPQGVRKVHLQADRYERRSSLQRLLLTFSVILSANDLAPEKPGATAKHLCAELRI